VRDLLILVAVYTSLPLIFFSPYFGLLVYSWLAYMHPQALAWGASRVTPLSAWVATAMLAGIALAFGREKLFSFKLQTALLALLGVWISITTWRAVSIDDAWIVYGLYWKAILISIVTTGLVRDRRRLSWLVIVIAFSIGLLGAKSGLYALLHGGARFNQGPGGQMMDNNHYALGLNMTIPLLLGIAMVERAKLLRTVAAAMAFLSILTVIFTFSRGGLLTLAAMGALLIWRSKHRVVASAVLLLGILGFFLVSTPEIRDAYFNRAESIGDYDEDLSAQGRLLAWRQSLAIFADHPVFGVGPNNMLTVFPTYSDGIHRFHVSHNAYLELLAECGFPSLALFLSLFAVSLYRLDRLRRLAAFPWVETYARMLQISLVAYLLGSLFLNTAYFDLIYHLLGISVSLELAAAAWVPEAAEARETAPADPWWRRAPAPPGARPAGRAHPAAGGLARVKEL
jgi:probable O-glycosylation ligase (exosortase A-associated)